MIAIPGTPRGQCVRISVEQSGTFPEDALERLVEMLRSSAAVVDAVGEIHGIGRIPNGHALEVVIETDRLDEGDAVHAALDAHYQAWESAGIPWAMQSLAAIASSPRRLDDIAQRQPVRRAA